MNLQTNICRGAVVLNRDTANSHPVLLAIIHTWVPFPEILQGSLDIQKPFGCTSCVESHSGKILSVTMSFLWVWALLIDFLATWLAEIFAEAGMKPLLYVRRMVGMMLPASPEGRQEFADCLPSLVFGSVSLRVWSCASFFGGEK